MGRGLGPLQVQILEALEKLWESEGPMVRLVESGVGRATRSKMLKAARRLRDRGLLELVQTWGLDSVGRATLVMCACPPGATVFSDELGKDIPVSQLHVSKKPRRDTSIPQGLDELGKRLARQKAGKGVHISPEEALEDCIKELSEEDEKLSLDERIELLQDRLTSGEK